MKVTVLLLAGVLLLALWGCGEDEGSAPSAATNIPPTIDTLSASPFPATMGDTVTVQCGAHDENGDALSYQWTSSSGELLEQSDQALVYWRTPQYPGMASLTVTVDDGQYEAVDSLRIPVILQPTLVGPVVSRE